MAKKSIGVYVLVIGVVVLAAGLVMVPLPGPGGLIAVVGFAVAALGAVLLLVERSSATTSAPPPSGLPEPPR